VWGGHTRRTVLEWQSGVAPFHTRASAAVESRWYAHFVREAFRTQTLAGPLLSSYAHAPIVALASCVVGVITDLSVCRSACLPVRPPTYEVHRRRHPRAG
jgi:hypothetical protein